MSDSIRLIGQYLKHRWNCSDRKGHGVHSPFFFDFITSVLPDTGPLSVHDLPERYRKELLADDTVFDRVDLGSGTKRKMSVNTVRGVALRSLQKPAWSRLLYRIIQHYRPGSVLELGTSLGVTTEYLAGADPTQTVYTIEGDPFLARRASERFEMDGFKNIQSITGGFDEVLGKTLIEMGQVGLVWLDGNHQKMPTIRYVEQLLPYLTQESVLILDDIYWSRGMQEAWESLKEHPQVRASIDLFRLGLLFFRTEFREPIHIRLPY